MQIQYYLRVLRETWWVVVAIALVSAGLGLAYSYSQRPLYEATATFVVNPGTRIADTYDLLYSIDTLAGRTSLATTYSNILKSQVIIKAAAASLGLPFEMTADYDINAVVLPDSSVLLLRVQGPSPVTAAALANAIGDSGLEYIRNLQEIYELRRLDPAAVVPEPISPDHQTNLLLSIMIGLAGGVAFAILRQLLLQFSSAQRLSIRTPMPEFESSGVKAVKNAGS